MIKLLLKKVYLAYFLKQIVTRMYMCNYVIAVDKDMIAINCEL